MQRARYRSAEKRQAPSTSARSVAWIIWLLAWCVIAGCGGPVRRIDKLADSHKFSREIIRGDMFEHVVYRNVPTEPQRALHIYIEGDGTPYRNRYMVASNPTPRNPLMLELMALDAAPSIYLGRPCYLGLQASRHCSADYWTVGRFSEEVARSMATAVERIRDRNPGTAREIVLIGHSGGAALAILLARRLPEVAALVTLAGNLDTAAWTDLHDYSPLRLSLNPVSEALNSVPTVLHLVGSEDRVTPPAFVSAAAKKLGDSEVRVVPGEQHTCCWSEEWASVLEDLP